MSTIKVQNIQHTGSSTNAIALASDGTCTANITNNLSNRNLIINGAMQLAQYGLSSTTSGYGTVDRWQVTYGNTDEALTQSQVDVASGTTPYSLGFRKALRATNGNQTSGAGSSDFAFMQQKIEAQNLATSGWNYTSPSSFITLSFWVKSSVAQNFYGYIKAEDATYIYPYETGSLSANTWTKVTKTILGNSNLVFNNDVGNGATLVLNPYLGTDYTDGSVSLNTWAAYASGSRTPNQTSTWWTTNDATLEITGVQLEVGSFSSDFQFKSLAEELALCQRYLFVLSEQTSSGSNNPVCNMSQYQSNTAYGVVHFPVTMRSKPSLQQTTGASYYKAFASGAGSSFSQFTSTIRDLTCAELYATPSLTQGTAVFVRTQVQGAKVFFSAEL